MNEKNEMFGHLRSAKTQLQKGAVAARESWEEISIMLSPPECADLNNNIRDCENALKQIRLISKKFCAIADSRIEV